MDRFEKIMWLGFAKMMLFLSAGAILTIIFEDFIFLIFGSGIALVIWIVYSIYHTKYMKKFELR